MTSAPPAPRRRVLLLTPRWPYPVVGGDLLRIWQLARAVSRQHDITLLSLCASDEELHMPVPDDGVFQAVHRVLHPRHPALRGVLGALPGRMPLQVGYYRNPRFAAQVAALAPAHDVVWSHLLRMAPYALSQPAPRWLELTDAVSMGMARVADSGLPPWSVRRWLYRLEARRLKPMEQAAAGQFDLVSLIAAPDAAHLWGTAPPPSVLIAPNGVSAPSRPLPPAGQRPPGIAFVGQLRSLANQDALAFLLAEVMPGVRQRQPDAQVHVVGPCPPAVRARWQAEPGVRWHGVVPDMATVLGDCRVGVCPVRIGAGMQNKLLDYLAHGLAAVTSPVGLEGLDATPGQHLLCAGDAAAWQDAVCGLLRDDALASALGAAGQALVTGRYGWEQALAPLVSAVDRQAAAFRDGAGAAP